MARMGKTYRVRNKAKKRGACDHYIALNVEDENGANERWLLFTENEFKRQAEWLGGGWSRMMKPGRLYAFCRKGGTAQWAVQVFGENVAPGAIIRLGVSLVKRLEKRAKSNTEDLPAKTWLQDIRD